MISGRTHELEQIFDSPLSSQQSGLNLLFLNLRLLVLGLTLLSGAALVLGNVLGRKVSAVNSAVSSDDDEGEMRSEAFAVVGEA